MSGKKRTPPIMHKIEYTIKGLWLLVWWMWLLSDIWFSSLINENISGKRTSSDAWEKGFKGGTSEHN